ncbi:MFS transporter [Alloalcanivorax mobilis]|uniref:MFS transporter n=1 Tax=Alloalcanivorax mobilis TaxID=2019569 RepID=UPI000B5B1D9B|nr:MFS transporter [Alloalcanivorax mobilis]ASK34697.1 MFS transporter [Alcanivorax sp. N3-2A]|tara:strand:- start:30675 stop:31940 length:1266 start_codon:yes stop_codon:yes gene_type:complete
MTQHAEQSLAPSSGSSSRWWVGATKHQWQTFRSAYLGWMLDIMDLMLFAMIITSVGKDLGFDKGAAGLVASATLLASAFGGLVFGFLADRIGRTRSMVLSILCYSVGTALCGLSANVWQLMVFRVVVGLGVGGEWSAGSALVSESWPARHRGKVLGWVQSAFASGYALAAITAAVILPLFGWRWVFVVGLLPALLAFYIRRHMGESEIWKNQTERLTLKESLRVLFKDHAATTTFGMALMITAMCGYWGLFTWIPTYLSTPVADGGAGLDLVKSTTWIVIMQVGAAIGFVSFGYISDAIGRRATFVTFFVVSAVAVPLYLLIKEPLVLMAFGVVVAFFGTGFYSGFAPTFAELYPTSIRATAQGVVYNGGRAVSAVAPAIIGFSADRFGLGSGLLLTSMFFALAALVVLLFLPKQKAIELE